VPSFWILEDEPMRAGTWVWASALSLLLVGASAVLMDHAGGHPLRSFAGAGRGAAGQAQWVPKESGAGMPQGDSDVELMGNGVGRSQTPGKLGSASNMIMAATAETKLDDAERQTMQEMYCTFARVETLPHNVGYMKINSFPDPAVCKTTAEALMARLNGSDAVIFDLRENKGGNPQMVSLLTGYLFAQPRHLYSPRGDGPENWTRPVTGSRLVNKPVYVLTSRATMSAAEQFSYNLKMLKRATLVGETTRGSARAGVFHGIEGHFGIGILEARAKNPDGAGGWEGVGVAPDVKAPAWDAQLVAERLAAGR
jgi:C-terminal processing protease CtpA/Prc